MPEPRSKDNGSLNLDTPLKVPITRYLEEVAERAAIKALDKWNASYRKATCPMLPGMETRDRRITKILIILGVLVAGLVGTGILKFWVPLPI